jgi:hypothetical protein
MGEIGDTEMGEPGSTRAVAASTSRSFTAATNRSATSLAVGARVADAVGFVVDDIVIDDAVVGGSGIDAPGGPDAGTDDSIEGRSEPDSSYPLHDAATSAHDTNTVSLPPIRVFTSRIRCRRHHRNGGGRVAAP